MPKWDSNPRFSVLERAKTVRALDRAATAIGSPGSEQHIML
jgi:hypothetical protein